MKFFRVASLVAATAVLSACSGSPKEQASGDFDYTTMNKPTSLTIPASLQQPATATEYPIPTDRGVNGPVGKKVNVMSPRLVRPIALGSRVLEDEQQSRAYFDIVDGMGDSVTEFVWQATANVLERQDIEWQQATENEWLTEQVSTVQSVDESDSFWRFSDAGGNQIERKFRYKLTQQPAEHQRTTALNVTLVDAVEQRSGSAEPLTAIAQANTEVVLLNDIISEVNRLQQQGVLAQGNQVVPLSLQQNDAQQPAFIIGMSFENAWPLAGLALNDIGLEVDDLNRDAGTYFVEYTAPDNGFLFIGGDDYEPLDIEESEYEIRLVEFNDDTAMTVLKEGEVVSEAWLQAIEEAFARALQAQNQR